LLWGAYYFLSLLGFQGEQAIKVWCPVSSGTTLEPLRRRSFTLLLTDCSTDPLGNSFPWTHRPFFRDKQFLQMFLLQMQLFL
jgi:hypothetical protein